MTATILNVEIILTPRNLEVIVYAVTLIILHSRGHGMEATENTLHNQTEIVIILLPRCFLGSSGFG